jgi:aryl sulfotransferase
MPQDVKWPMKTREIHNAHFDSSVWNDFTFRPDDIVIATWAKSGTTWTQQIIAQLLFAGEEGLPVADMSPWLDLRVPPKEERLRAVEAQTHRRFIKTHLPVDALVYSPGAKYIFVGRDGRDVAWSAYNHWEKANATWYDALNNTPGLVGLPIGKPPATAHQYFVEEWLENIQRDDSLSIGQSMTSFWHTTKSWWDIRDLPNLLFLHFVNLKADLPGSIRQVASFLGIPIDEDRWQVILDHCSFEYMKVNASDSVALGGAFLDGGAQTFIHRGVNGRWRDSLSEAESLRYEQIAERELGKECAYWLSTGQYLGEA